MCAKRKGNNIRQVETPKEMVIPTGKLYGSLPEHIIIDGVEWVVFATGIVEGKTYDKIMNTKTNERKTVERGKLLNFLQKHLHEQK